ncbi:MAG: hypothetical protein K6F49_03390 [Saccharofermentans sp.]|nr:hypothetical protein [Saccharofermentans sp.]
MIFKKNKTTDKPTFYIDSPELAVTPDAHDIEERLQEAGIAYRVINPGYIVFSGHILQSDIPLMIGLHYRDDLIDFIEIFRPAECYQAEDFDVDRSFEELSDMVEKRFGPPTRKSGPDKHQNRSELWKLNDYTISHSVYERFVRQESLSIRFTS